MKMNNRNGVAAVEFALAAPVILIFAFAVLEITNGIYLQQSITVAAYEGTRVAVLPDTDSSNVEAAVDRILNTRGIEGGSVSVSPANFGTVAFGDPISVTVEIPMSENRVFARHFAGDSQLNVSITMMKEQ